MHLDALTLMVPGAFAAAFAGLFLLGAWLQHKNAPALLWWACAHAVNALGISGIVAGITSKQPLVLLAGVGVASIGPILIWCGVRRFYCRRIPLILAAGGPAIFLATAFAPLEIDHERWATTVAFASTCAYIFAAILELWRDRTEKLCGRWPLIALMAIHTLPFLAAIEQLLAGTFPLGEPPQLDSSFGIVQFVQILYASRSAFFMASMCKERSELRHKKAAMFDALTGVHNHGAFLEQAHRILHRCQINSSPCSLIMFDLDHFKTINDTHGHQAGDRVLQSFTETARALLRPTDLFGRYGGEEFLVILPDTAIEPTAAIAERIRHSFAETHRQLDNGQPLNATVSAGVASASRLTGLDRMIEAADGALYMAKRSGRNRVERV
ncbi:MAG TPA: GGDEF domain-containing protein, partial [Hyphomicrobiales bacterium]|nr:GGDEF domain-containing protein [Hyphomicrobiales bacterium]